MSKGLGKLQSEIIQLMMAREGGDIIEREFSSYMRRYCGKHLITKKIQLAAGWHDMRRVADELAAATGFRKFQRKSPSWYAAMSRAVRTLESRGMIQFPNLVELTEDSTHPLTNEGQRRYGRISVKTNVPLA